MAEPSEATNCQSAEDRVGHLTRHCFHLDELLKLYIGTDGSGFVRIAREIIDLFDDVEMTDEEKEAAWLLIKYAKRREAQVRAAHTPAALAIGTEGSRSAE